MQTSIVGLRKNMKDVKRALARQEPVTITDHGTPIGVIYPMGHRPEALKKKKKYTSVKDHPCFGMGFGGDKSVEEIMHDLRKPRYEM